MPMITGPGAFDPLLGKMRTKDVSGGTASGDYMFNTAEFTVGAAGLVSLNQVPASKLDTVSDIVNVTGASVTLQPNTAYKIYATSQAITLNANTPAAGKWAYEGHLEIFTAGTGYVVTGSNVVLANALEPDAVNNCTVRFHDGIAIISVEDHVAGYIVVNGSTSGDGSLAYGIATSTNDYIAFDASLNGQTIPLAGAVAEGEKHVVGNGYAETTITGAVDCGTSKFTAANLSLNNIQIVGGTMTLGDVFIPSGSTVAVSGGGLTLEKVAGEGETSVIDYGGNEIPLAAQRYKVASASNVKFTNAYGTAAYTARNAVGNIFTNCTFIGNTTTTTDGGGGVLISENGSCLFSGCVFSGNSETTGVYPSQVSVRYTSAVGTFNDCMFVGNSSTDITIGARNSGKIYFGGTNKFPVGVLGGDSTGTLTLTSGAVLDLTGNSNSTPISPGGGVIVSGGCQVITSAGTTVSIAGGTYTKIKNDGTTE